MERLNRRPPGSLAGGPGAAGNSTAVLCGPQLQFITTVNPLGYESRQLEWVQLRVDLLTELAQSTGRHAAMFADWLCGARATKAQLERQAFGGGQ